MRRRIAKSCAAAVLALGLVLAAPGVPASVAPAAVDGEAGAARAWAQNLDNADVPTDDTGVVTPVKPDEQEGAGEGGANDGAGSAAPTSPEGEGGQPADGTEPSEGAGADEAADGEAPADGETDSEGEAGSEGEADGAEGQPAPGEQAPALATDPVFGNQKNADNLVNPQQKPDSSFIYDTSISALQEADAYLNDQTVQVTGEVVGDRLKAEFDPGYCWIVLQANEENYAEIPVFITEELTELIDMYGSYGRKGTTLQIRGIFHLACPEHEGLTDLHADTVSVVEKGSVTEQVLDPRAFAPGGALVLLGAIMAFVFHRMREGQR